MADPQRKVKLNRILGVFALSVLMSPIWHFAIFRRIVLTEVWSTYFFELLPFFIGSLLVGAIFVAVAIYRGQAPSIYYSILVPAIGAFGFQIVASFYGVPAKVPTVGQFLDGYIATVLPAYFLIGFITIPLSVIQTLLMRRIIGIEDREEGLANSGPAIGGIP